MEILLLIQVPRFSSDGNKFNTSHRNVFTTRDNARYLVEYCRAFGAKMLLVTGECLPAEEDLHYVVEHLSNKNYHDDVSYEVYRDITPRSNDTEEIQNERIDKLFDKIAGKANNVAGKTTDSKNINSKNALMQAILKASVTSKSVAQKKSTIKSTVSSICQVYRKETGKWPTLDYVVKNCPQYADKIRTIKTYHSAIIKEQYFAIDSLPNFH